MVILAALPENQLKVLKAATGSDYEFVVARDAESVVSCIRSRAVEIAVVDPVGLPAVGVYQIERVRRLFPSLPILIYTALVPEIAEVLLAVGQVGIRRALFARFDDSPASIRCALRDELERSSFSRVIRDLEAVLAELPDDLRCSVEQTLASPGATVSLLAQHAKLGRRTCERWFARSGLPSPRLVLMVARLLYAHRLLLDPGYTVDDVATKLGYGRVRTMQSQFREVFGTTAGEMRLSVSPDAAVAMVRERYFPKARQAAS